MAGIFKTEEEVEEFINTIGTEYKFGCLHEKDPEACFLLGQWYHSEREDLAKALEINKKGCDELNYSKCCFQVGQAYLFGRSVDKSASEAFKYYKKGCSESKATYPRDYGLSCLMGGQIAIGLFEVDDKSKVSPPSEGLSMLEKACGLGSLDSCEILHQVFRNGTSSVSKDEKKSLKYAERSCDLSSLPGCYAAYDMYRKGIGTEKNAEKASEFKKKLKELEEQVNVGAQMGMYTT
ncbi:cytochrome c oxidase assembly factor 7 [Brevipalpus obovatus]|uniref:cytochrome c oxidase assembly factor 7 n=1 Tax=Brevipalpus obovatus TaxID=246614 RepID=UPI003D9F22B9